MKTNNNQLMKTKSFLFILCLSIAGSIGCAQKPKSAVNSPKGIVQSTAPTTAKPTTAITKQVTQKQPVTSQSSAAPSVAPKPSTTDVKKTPSVIEERTTHTETVLEIIPEAAPDSEIKKP
jgi:hypothetical protein